MDTIFLETPKTTSSMCPSEKNYEPPRILKRVLLMDRMIDLLVEKAKSGLFWPDLYVHAEHVLASLSETPSHRKKAKRHLGNALGYSRHLEFGAAAFELRMLRSQLA